MQTAESVEELEKGREVAEWNSHMSYFAVQRALERRSGTTASNGGFQQQQHNEATGDSLQTGLSREPDSREESTRREQVDGLGLSSNLSERKTFLMGAITVPPAVLCFGRCTDQGVQCIG